MILVVIISLLIFDFLLESYLDMKNRQYSNNPIPEELEGVYENDKYKKQQEYFIAKNKFSFVLRFYGLVIMLLMFLFNGFGLVDGLSAVTCSHIESDVLRKIMTGLCFFGILYYADDILNLPFSIYSVFKIEEKFGFNRTNAKTFVLDLLKNWLLTAIFGGILLGLLMLVYYFTADFFALLGLAIVVAFSVFTMMFYSSVIVPLFNKQTPLQEGDLRTAIEELCKKVDFKLDNLFVIDSSKRTSKANAYFSGLGTKKRIVLYDTLISSLSTNEIVAVLSHEIGHYKRKHTRKMLIMNIIYFAIIFFLLSLFLNHQDYVAKSIGIENGSFWISMVVFGVLFSPISSVMSIVINVISRKNEYEADSFAKECGNGEALISALKKLSSDSLSNLTPHPIYIFFKYSHPTLLQRIKAIRGK